jgi:hypothetical protein
MIPLLRAAAKAYLVIAQLLAEIKEEFYLAQRGLLAVKVLSAKNVSDYQKSTQPSVAVVAYNQTCDQAGHMARFHSRGFPHSVFPFLMAQPDQKRAAKGRSHVRTIT